MTAFGFHAPRAGLPALVSGPYSVELTVWSVPVGDFWLVTADDSMDPPLMVKVVSNWSPASFATRAVCFRSMALGWTPAFNCACTCAARLVEPLFFESM